MIIQPTPAKCTVRKGGGVLAAIQGVKVQMDYLHLATYNEGQDKNKIQKITFEIYGIECTQLLNILLM